MGFLISLLFSAVPLAALWAIVCYGPIRSPWWRHETPIGFALFVGGLSFLIGFLGPIILTPEANQGPLLGIFITGPAGLLAGLIWGLARAARRGRPDSNSP